MGMKGLLSCVAVLLLLGHCSAGPAGREFATVFMLNYRAQYGPGSRFLIQVSAPLTLKGPTRVNVSVPSLGIVQKRTIGPGEGVTFDLPKSVEMTNSAKSGKTVRIEATQEVLVMSLNYKTFTADTSVIYPVTEWGTEYYVFTPNTSPVGTFKEFSITNYKDHNSVEVYVKTQTRFQGHLYQAGSKIPIDLEPFESVQIQSKNDMTGTRVVSRLPVAVSTGHSCTWKFTTCNHVYEQLLPVNSWGKSFIIVPLNYEKPSERYDSIIIQASQLTQVTVQEDGEAKTVTMHRGDMIHYNNRWPVAFHITADKGIQVLFQFNGAVAGDGTKYDPFLMTILPTDRFCTAYTLEGQTDFTNLAIMVAPTKDLKGLTFDKTPDPKILQWRSIAGSEYSWAEISYSKGASLHRAAHLRSPFGVYSFGVAQLNGYGAPALCSPVDCSIVKCAPSEECKMEGDIATCIKKPPPVKMGTCWVMGDPHYRTFDGQYFNFMGNCTYTMVKNCQIDKEHPAFEVEAKNDNRGNTQVTSVSKVIVKVYGHVIEMIRGDLGLVRLDYQDWSLPINLDKGKVTLVNSGLSALLETDFGLTVQYDWEQYLVVTVPGSYAGKVCGLCGNFNGKRDDDMTTPTGSKASNVVALGKSWRVHSAEGDSHCRDECTGKCANCKSSFLGHLGAEFFCSTLTVLMKGPFRSCHAVIDPSIFHDICMYDFCMGDGVRKYLCDSLQVYTDACQRAGIEVYNWRRLARCPDPKCQEHSHYDLCGNACPATCENPHAPSKCKGHCVETCACDPGYLLSGNKCVPSSQCGCKYEGRYVLPNQSFWGNNDCTKNCTCNPTSGKVECHDTVCPSGKQCQVVDGLRDCYPMSYATCLATGDPHYLTFDGHRYNLPGTCVYQMAGVCSKDKNLEPFDILVQNHVQNNRVGSVTKLVEVKVYEQSIVITKQYRKHVVMVNGEIVNLPINLLDKRVLVYKSGLYAVIKTNFGLKVYFDWNSVVIVNVPNTYEGAMCGLCGNYNNKPQDDMKMKDGKVAPTVKELGESWRMAKIPGCVDGCRGPCPDCDITQLEQYKTNEYCGLLNDPKGPFRKCHAVWDPSHLVQDCLYDVCLYKGKNNMQCNILAAYTSICQKQGVEVEDWRNLTKCSYPCQKNSHYEICASGCPATCATLAPPVGCKSPCMEDCVCDEGYILSGDKCVPFSKCGCTLEGKYYKIGQTFYPHGKCEEECTCNDDGMVDCKKFTCGPNERCEVKNGQRGCHPFGSGNCSIYGDPHYRTFDNSTYDFQGTCTYTVSKACHLEGTRLKPFSVVVENENWNGVIDFKADTPPVNVSVARSVAVQVYAYTLILRKNQIGSIMVNGILYTLPMELNNGAVKAYEHGFQDVIETDFGLKVTYDLVFKVTVTVPGNYRGKTCGLCGNFNDDASDEFQMPDGKITKSMKDFGAAWKVSTPDVVCDDGCSGNICPQCEEKKKHLFEKDCAMINDKNGPFAACHDVLDPASYFRDCVFDVCMGEGNRKILCSSIDAYVSDCQKLGVKINNWRTSTFCPRSCPANSHYETCAKTCDSPCPGLVSIVQCPADCAEGCTCNDGFYFNGTGCVALDQCSCYFGGRTYKPREILILDNCQLKCTCQDNGEVECDLMECKPDEVCGVKNGVEGCYPRQCQVEAGGVFTLFDGMGGTVTAMGAYEIVSVCDQGLAAEWFRVVVDVRRCGKTGRASITSVYVFFEDMLVSVNENHETWVNGRKVSLPKTLKGDIMVKTSEKVAVIEKRSGLHVSYSLDQEISVTVGAHLTDKVCGACGKVDASSVFAHGKATNIQDFQAYMNIWKALDFSHCGL